MSRCGCPCRSTFWFRPSISVRSRIQTRSRLPAVEPIGEPHRTCPHGPGQSIKLPSPRCRSSRGTRCGSPRRRTAGRPAGSSSPCCSSSYDLATAPVSLENRRSYMCAEPEHPSVQVSMSGVLRERLRLDTVKPSRGCRSLEHRSRTRAQRAGSCSVHAATPAAASARSPHTAPRTCDRRRCGSSGQKRLVHGVRDCIVVLFRRTAAHNEFGPRRMIGRNGVTS